jgi:hypothetical protein
MMQPSETKDPDFEVSGMHGFSIEVLADEIRVYRSLGAFCAQSTKKRMTALLLSAAASCLLFLGQMFYLKPTVLTWIICLPWTGLPLAIAIRILYPGTKNLRCTRQAIELERRFLGRTISTLSFPKADVGRFRYVAPLFPWIASANHLSFWAAGKWLRCLPGLGSEDGQQILNALERLGYEVAGSGAGAEK